MLRSLTSLFERLGERKEEATLGEHELRVASAALLVHAIGIDGTVTETESARLAELIADHFSLSKEDVHRLLIEAERQEREAIDIYRFTSLLRDSLSLEQKREIIGLMWRVVFADGRLEALEDNLIWRTAELLAVPARDRMQLKQLVRAELETE